MKIYISESDSDVSLIRNKFQVVDKFEDADTVLILPGGLGTFCDLFRAIDNKKKTIIYNKNMFFKSLIENLYESYQVGYEDRVPADYIDIECELEEIVKKLEER